MYVFKSIGSFHIIKLAKRKKVFRYWELIAFFLSFFLKSSTQRRKLQNAINFSSQERIFSHADECLLGTPKKKKKAFQSVVFPRVEGRVRKSKMTLDVGQISIDEGTNCIFSAKFVKKNFSYVCFVNKQLIFILRVFSLCIQN